MASQDNTPSQPTVAEIMTTLLFDTISEEEQTSVTTLIGDLPAEEVAQLKPYQLVTRLQQALQNFTSPKGSLAKPPPLNVRRLGVIAREVISHLNMMLGNDAITAAQPTMVTAVIQQDTRPQDMDLEELLKALAAKPTSLTRLRPYLDKLTVRAARATGDKWVIPLATTRDAAEGPNLDVASTAAYVATFDLPYTVAQSRVDTANGQMIPITLADALGTFQRPLKHPRTGEPINGADDMGFNIGRLDPQFLEVITYAREQKHKLFPSTMDYYMFMKEIFQEADGGTRTDRWMRITEDYAAAKAQGTVGSDIRYHVDAALSVGVARLLYAESGNLGQSGYGTADPDPYTREDFGRSTRGHVGDDGARYGGGHTVIGGPGAVFHAPVVGKVVNHGVPASIDYLAVLRANARGCCKVEGMGARTQGGIYSQISIAGMDAKCANVIILDGGKVEGMGASGQVFALTSADISVEGMDATVQVIPMSAERLYAKAKELGYI